MGEFLAGLYARELTVPAGHISSAHITPFTTRLHSLVLAIIGLATIGVGIWYQRNEAEVRAAIVRVLPAALREVLPASRA